MRFTIPLFNNDRISVFAPILLIIAILWIYPVADMGDPRFSAYFRFASVAVILFSIAIWQVNKWVAMFLILAGFSSIFPFSTKYSTEAFRAVFIGCIWYYMITQIPKEKIKYMLDAICILALCNIAILICQHFGFDPIFKPKRVGAALPVVGFLSNRNEVSAFLSFCLPAFFRTRWRWLIPLLIIGISISMSTGGAVTAVIVLVAYFVLKDGIKYFFVPLRGSTAIHPSRLIVFVLTLWLVLFMFKIDPVGVFDSGQIGTLTSQGKTKMEALLIVGTSYRYETWAKALTLYKQHWLFGSGIGHWKIVFMPTQANSGWFKHAHNEFIQGLFEMGMLFPILIVGYLIGNIKKYTRETITSAVAIIAVCVNSLINFPLHIAQTAIIAITWMAIFEVQNKKSVISQERSINEHQTREVL